MFLRERMMEDFVQESDSLLFLTALLLSVHRRRGNFRHMRRRAWAWPRPQNWESLSDKNHDFEISLLSGFLSQP